MRAFACLLALCLALAAPAQAQDAATLVADRVEVRGNQVLVAEGNIEVFWRGARLTASRILYDRAADRLSIEGPITLTDQGQVALFADAGKLSADLQNGILQSARLVLDQQLQLAANEIARIDGRYTELSKVVASSCEVCANNPVPLWSIRARRVIHDQEERQIYFEGAQLRIYDVPIAYIPRLRLPDPTLDRANGFLFPSVRSTSQLGFGLKTPYFLTLGPSADVTLTPYLSSSTTTLELRYRQAFRRGDITFEGAVSRDDILPDETRYYLFGKGDFDLPRGYQLSFGVEIASDDAYLLDYGYSDADRLESSVAITRTRRDRHTEARLSHFRTLRDDEVNSAQPTIVSEYMWERRFTPAALGGIATLNFGALTSYRNSNLDGDGRDVSRATATFDWERTEIFGLGLLATFSTGLAAEFYDVTDDSTFDDTTTRLMPEAALTLRWPLSRVSETGVTHIIEPVAMLAWSRKDPEAVPNEDSTLSEFDEANLLSFDRFPGTDGNEEGLRLSLGLSWTRHDPAGWTIGLTAARILREKDFGTFEAGTGLNGDSSDWLVAATLDLPNRVDLTARALFDNDLTVSKADFRMGYGDARFDIETGLLILAPAPTEDRPDRVAEWAMDADWRINQQWTGSAEWRYDFEAGRATSAGIGFGWENECARVDLSLSRRFTSSTSVRPTTDFGLSVELAGFGTGGQGGAARRRCVN